MSGATETRAPSGQPVTPGAADERLLDELDQLAESAVRAAAIACLPLVARGSGRDADAAATDAMRSTLAATPLSGRVVIGEGEKDAAPMLYNGEEVGGNGPPQFDVAVDPLECTDLCAGGLPGAITTIALAPAGSLLSPGPAHYMDKLVVAAPARDVIDLDAEPEQNLERIARALGKPISSLIVVVLDKPRHEQLVRRLRATGAAVITPSAGDVGAAVLAALPGSDVDVLMGIGGTPEGVLAACAVNALGGGFQGRLAPQRAAEADAVTAAGLDTGRIMTGDDLAPRPAVFAATGVTGGSLVRAPWHRDNLIFTETLVIRTGRVRRIVEATALPPMQED